VGVRRTHNPKYFWTTCVIETPAVAFSRFLCNWRQCLLSGLLPKVPHSLKRL